MVHLEVLNILNSSNPGVGAPAVYEGKYEKNDETLKVVTFTSEKTLALKKLVKELILGKKS